MCPAFFRRYVTFPRAETLAGKSFSRSRSGFLCRKVTRRARVSLYVCVCVCVCVYMILTTSTNIHILTLYLPVYMYTYIFDVPLFEIVLVACQGRRASPEEITAIHFGVCSSLKP